MCRDTKLPIWHCDPLHRLTEALDLCLIKDEASVSATCRGPRIEVPPLTENLVERVELAQGDDTSVLDHHTPLWPPLHM